MSDKIIKTSPTQTLYPDLYVRGEGYIVYFKVKQCKETNNPIAYLSRYKFCGTLNYDDSNIRLLEFCYDHIERTPNAQIIQKSDEDKHSPMMIFFIATHAVNNHGSPSNQVHLTNEEREGIPVFAVHNPSVKSLKIFNFDLSLLKQK